MKSISQALVLEIIALTGGFMRAESTKQKRGRPKGFDEQEVLQKAMLLFWQYGYEATSLHDLTRAMKLTAPSLYRCFGDKAQLFHRCLDFYVAQEACAIDRILSEAKTAKIALELYLLESVKTLSQANKPSGCMLVVSAMNCSEQNRDIQQSLYEKRLSVQEKISARLALAQSQGEISQDVCIEGLYSYFMTVLSGLSIQARDGASVEQLNQTVSWAMRSWPTS